MQIRFGEFTVDAGSRELRQGDSVRHLSPKAFDFLWMLLQHRPRALSKGELHERLWPSTFVSDSTLTSLVAEVRTALDERAHDGRFVRTVHRFGYAFSGTAVELTGRHTPFTGRPRCWVIWEWGQIGLPDGDHLLGRAADVAIWLESPTVSRHHARLRVTETAIVIEDLQSKNGTHLGNEPLHGPAPVADGEEIRLGSVTVKIRLVDAIGSTATHTP